MGSFISKIIGDLPSCKKKRNVLLLGLDGAGKSNIIYRIKSPDLVQTTVPVIGYDLEYRDFNNMTIYAWDLGGSLPLTKECQPYISKADALIYVVDSNDKARFKHSKDQLNLMLDKKLSPSCPLLVLANKIDLSGEEGVIDVMNALDLKSLKDRPWHIQGTYAIKNEGFIEGFGWMIKTLNKENQSM